MKFLPLGILPVLTFLVLLLYLDSFKLVRLRFILSAIVTGACLAVVAYFINRAVLDIGHVNFTVYARYVSPVLEELLKAAAVYYLVRKNLLGFLVDGAILGFSIGAGFALVENIFYLLTLHQPGIGTWVVRGFGTAIMHGGTVAIFTILTLTLRERAGELRLVHFLPGLMVGVVIHSAFNHLSGSPYLASGITIVVLPLFMYLVFERSTASLQNWLEQDFDYDMDLIQQIGSAEFEETTVGRYLVSLQQRFDPLTIADMLSYIRIYTELSMRAKGVMLMRQNDLEVPRDPTVEGKFADMKQLESSIGRTGMLALDPLLHMDAKDLWHLNVLEASTR